MTLIPNWRKWYRMFSVQALLVIGAIQSVLMVVGAGALAGAMPFLNGFTWGDFLSTLTIATAVLGAIGRVIDQGEVTE
jgi:hypothetical protein